MSLEVLPAGTSGDDYAKMERGDVSGVSAEVLDALARALQLDDAEIDLPATPRARSATPGPSRRRRRPAATALRPSLQLMLDAITGKPAWIVNQRGDIIATNYLGRALMAPLLDDASNGANNARFIFLDPASPNCLADWNSAADAAAASLLTAAGRNPHDTNLTNLIGERW